MAALKERAKELRKEIADKKKKRQADEKAAKEKVKAETKYLQALLAANPVSSGLESRVVLLLFSSLPFLCPLRTSIVNGWPNASFQRR